MIYRTSLIIVCVLITACSDDQALKDKRAQAQEYYRTTNTVIPQNDEIKHQAKPRSNNSS